MSLSWTQQSSAMMRSLALVAAAPPLRYGVVAVIVVSMGFAWGHLLPVIRHDLQLLHDVYAIDEQGIALEGDLQYEIQESRRRFLRILLAGGKPAEVDQETRSMRGYDATVALTESRIAQLGVLPEGNRRQFRDNWLHYVALRDQMLVTALGGDQEEVRKVDTDLGKGTFETVEQAVRDAQVAFEASSARHVGEVSSTLNAAVKELFSFTLIRVLALTLLVWTDWKRIRAEKQLQRATRDLRASEDRFHQAYESAVVGMGIFTLDGTVLSANAKAAQILGCEVSELIGTKVSGFMAPEHVDDHLHRLATLPQSQHNSYQTERRVIRKDGAAAWVRNSVTLMRPEGQEPYYFSISEEITLQHQAHDRLAYLANYDPVTNLPNRRFFEEQLASALNLIAGNMDCVALLYLEIDSFDFLKGTFGRTVADEVLADLGNSLVAFRQEGEIVARLDDYVFGMLVMAAPYDEATMTRAGQLREIFHRASGSSKHRIPLSASIGIAYSDDGVSGSRSQAETLLKYARAAMLEARSRGGDSIFVADPSLQERAAQRHQIESALLRGLREDEFRVVFQPQFEIATGKLVRFEALSRWTSAELGPIPPDRFIPIAEQTGLIMEIGRRTMNEALRQAKTWTDSGRRIGVGVNISPMQFMRPDFTHIVTEVLALSGFPPALLELEITEGIFIRDLNLAVARIRELQRLGLSIALDDFGTGYSSLSYLQRMPIDAVKLDRSFVSDLTTDAATVSMVRSVLAMADALNLRVVTEGVETEQQLEILRELGCDEAQGYLLGRPESAEMALRRVLDSPLQRMGTLA
jgi:PAS domain S-box-containing protein/diguanylate cyclase (GGDEF)-like protein